MCAASDSESELLILEFNFKNNSTVIKIIKAYLGNFTSFY
jgi:hypothetical protein